MKAKAGNLDIMEPCLLFLSVMIMASFIASSVWVIDKAIKIYNEKTEVETRAKIEWEEGFNHWLKEGTRYARYQSLDAAKADYLYHYIMNSERLRYEGCVKENLFKDKTDKEAGKVECESRKIHTWSEE